MVSEEKTYAHKFRVAKRGVIPHNDHRATSSEVESQVTTCSQTLLIMEQQKMHAQSTEHAMLPDTRGATITTP
eukprot:3971704-Amphidinium_carterae.1